MALETGDYLDDLSANNPTGTDQKAFGDDHIRLIKKVIRQTFTKADGSTPWDQALDVDPDDVSNGYVPVGGIIIWSGAVGAIPTNWALANGTANSGGSGIDLTDKFVIAAGGNYSVGDTGGSATAGVITTAGNTLTITDSHVLTESQIPAHTHVQSRGVQIGGAGGAGTFLGSTASAFSTQSTGGGLGHTHNISDHTHTVSPPYYALAYIERIS